MTLSRRSLLAAGALLPLGAGPLAAAAIATPAQTEGPFYPRAQDLPDDRDNDLVRLAGTVADAGGEVLHLSGSVADRSGALLAGALVEIWQCDAEGRYIHGRDWSLSRGRDPAFQGYGKTLSDGAGRFAFRTIKPVAYPGRTPHIHFKLHHPGTGAVLTTQMYRAGEPQNRADGLYRRLSHEEQQALSVEFTQRPDGTFEGFFPMVL